VLPAGTLRPIQGAALGKVLLATKPEAGMPRLLRAVNALGTDPARRVPATILRRELGQIRERGWADSEHVVTSGVAALAVPLTPPLPEEPVMAVGVGGHVAQLRAQREVFVDALRQTCVDLAANLRRGETGT
jgi:DNA-binding IclR family transcriptional regulator